MSEPLVVLTTVESPEDGERLANLIVEGKLAACVQVLPPMKSVYWWEGRIEQSREVLLLIKTTRANYSELEEAIRQNHPYQTPEIIALKVAVGFQKYLDWVENSVKPAL